MSYPSPYQSPQQGYPSPQPGYASPQGYPAPGGGYTGPGGGYPAPPRKRRGLKRIILGSVGMVLNFIGLFVMPFVLGIAAAVFTMATATPEMLGPEGGTFSADGSSFYGVAVPADEVGSASCQIDGQSVEVENTDPEASTVPEVDGVEYVEIHDITVDGAQEVTVDCTGTTSVAIVDYGLIGTVLGLGAGLVIPIVFGTLSFVLLVWGIIARVRS